MANTTRIAIITGGVSGIGYATARALLVKGNWNVCLIDINQARGEEAVGQLGSEASFWRADITDYTSLSKVFQAIYEKQQRLDFVYANAGIVSGADFYTHEGTEGTTAPPPPNRKVVDVDLHGVISTACLAHHYLTLSGNPAEKKDIIVTASAAGFYPVPYDPLYAAAKHGVIGFVRSIASRYWKPDGVRTNAVCPSLVKTNILPEQMFEQFPAGALTPVETVVNAVMMLLDNEEYVGQTVEVFGEEHFFRKKIDFCSAGMAAVMGAAEEL